MRYMASFVCCYKDESRLPRLADFNVYRRLTDSISLWNTKIGKSDVTTWVLYSTANTTTLAYSKCWPTEYLLIIKGKGQECWSKILYYATNPKENSSFCVPENDNAYARNVE
jgi:hypothetical protein